MEYAEKVRCYQNVVQKYCSRRCERIASLRREAGKKKKDNAESFRNAEKNNSLRDKAFLSPEDDCTKIYEGRNTFFNKKAIDAHFADLLEEIDIDNYYTAEQIMEMYNMTKASVISFVMRHKVSRVNRNGKAYYSKVHIDCIKCKDDSIDTNWSTYEEAMEKYGISKDQISYTLKNFDVRMEKRGKFTMIFRTDFDKVMREQMSIKHVGVITREHNMPKIALKGFKFYEKKAINILYNLKKTNIRKSQTG